MATEYTGEVIPIKEYTGEVISSEHSAEEYEPPKKKKDWAAAAKSHDILGNTVQAISEPVVSMASSMLAKPVSELAGLGASAYGMATGNLVDAEGIQNKVRDKLTYEPRTAGGKSSFNPLNAIPMAVGKGIAAVTPDKAADPSTLSGMVRNAASEAVPQAIGIAGAKYAPKAAAPAQKVAKVLRTGAEDLMQSAVKPTAKDLLNGNAAKAIDTMLEKGIPATSKGIEQIRARIDELNDQIKDSIATSPERVETRKLLQPVMEKLRDFKLQANPDADISAIKKSWDEFKNHPLLQSEKSDVVAAKAKVEDRDAAAAKALQDAWKLKTFEEQQKGLAHGGGIKSSEGQPEGQPYINVGGINAKEKISSSAYPLKFMPRIAGKYTEQIERVPEGASGYKDAMDVYRTRKVEADAARTKLSEAQAKEGTMPVQLAQALKQGTYKQLSKKYGQLGSADVEAQKAIARGLKEQVAEKVPAIASLNAEESKLLNVLSVAERRIVMEANKNPMGLALLAKDPRAWATFLADRSASAKSLLARIMNRASKKMTGEETSGAVKAGSVVAPTQTSKEKQKQYEMAQHPELENP